MGVCVAPYLFISVTFCLFIYLSICLSSYLTLYIFVRVGACVRDVCLDVWKDSGCVCLSVLVHLHTFRVYTYIAST